MNLSAVASGRIFTSCYENVVAGDFFFFFCQAYFPFSLPVVTGLFFLWGTSSWGLVESDCALSLQRWACDPGLAKVPCSSH